MDNSLLLIVILAVGACSLLGYGLYLQVTRRKAILAERLETYATIEEEAARTTQTDLQNMSPVPRLLHVLLPRGYMARLEEELARADLPIRSSEYVLLRLVLAGAGFL